MAAASANPRVAVVGAGVVGASVALALARRGAEVTVLEAESAPAYGASGTNSGILHTGFDSPPGELETRLILRSAALRAETFAALRVPVLACGAVLRPRDERERAAVAALGARATGNGVETAPLADAGLAVPGESICDPVAFTLALVGAAEGLGAVTRFGARLTAVRADGDAFELRDAAGATLARADALVNCAGLYADEVAAACGDRDLVSVHPRKGEFFAFAAPRGGLPEHILLPVPDDRTKGVLVFPTVDGHVVAGPTVVDGTDKQDWRVRPEAAAEVREKAAVLLPALARCEPVAAWCGLRPAGRDANYVIALSRSLPRVLHCAAIRSTGLSASLGIAEHACERLSEAGLPLGEPAPLPAVDAPRPVVGPWWLRAARHRRLAA